MYVDRGDMAKIYGIPKKKKRQLNAKPNSHSMFARLRQRWRQYWSTTTPTNLPTKTEDILSIPQFQKPSTPQNPKGPWPTSSEMTAFTKRILSLPGEIRNLIYDHILSDATLFPETRGGALPVPAPWILGMSYFPYARVSPQYPNAATKKAMPCLQGQIWEEFLARFCETAHFTIEARFNVDDVVGGKKVGYRPPFNGGGLETVRMRESEAIRKWISDTVVLPLKSTLGEEEEREEEGREHYDIPFYLPKIRHCTLILHLSGSTVFLLPPTAVIPRNAKIAESSTAQIVSLMSAVSSLFTNAESLQDLNIDLRLASEFTVEVNRWIEPLRCIKVGKSVTVKSAGRVIERESSISMMGP